jgi:hypothetical protein
VHARMRALSRKTKMPDVDCGVAIRHLVDVQQRLNCALPRHFFEPRFAFAIRGLHGISMNDQLAPKAFGVDSLTWLAVDLCLRTDSESRFLESRISARSASP